VKLRLNVTDKITALIGTAGTAATFSLAQLNDMVGIAAGLLTVAYLIRQHRNLNKK
jgi:hypothetical protein